MEKQIWLKSVTAEMLSEVEVLDWLEGYGDVLSLAERDYIRKYGFLLLKQAAKINWLKDLLAIIHRDGGHHTFGVGLEQSIKDARTKVTLDREENERMKTNAENTIRKIDGDNAPDEIIDPVYSLSVMVINIQNKNKQIEEAYRRARQIVDDVQMVGGWTRERKIAYIEEVIKGNN